MPFPITPELDDFTRANETPLAPPWGDTASWGGQLNLVSDHAVNGSAGGCTASYYTPPFASPTCEAWIVLATAPTVDNDYVELGLLLDGADATEDGYFASISTFGGVQNWAIGRIVAGVSTGLLGGVPAFADGDRLGIRRLATGSLQLWLGPPGSEVLLGEVSDLTHNPSSYQANVGICDNGTVRVGSFGGGAISNQGSGIAFLGVSSVATGTVSLSVSRPAVATAVGDYLELYLSHKGAGFATVPAGWTLIRQGLQGAIRGERYWKRVESGEAASYSVTGLADTACGFIAAYRGVLLAGDPIEASSIALNASGTELATAITTLGAFRLVTIGVSAALNTSVAFNGPSPSIGGVTYTETQDGGTNNGSDSRVAGAHNLYPFAASTNDIAYNLLTNTDSVAILVAVLPEPSPGPGDVAFRIYPTKIPPPTRRDGPVTGPWAFGDIVPLASMPVKWELMASPSKAGGGTQSNHLLSTNQQGDVDISTMSWNLRVAAQTISGQFDWCWMMRETWNAPSASPTDDSNNCYVAAIYLMVGETEVVRATLLAPYVDPTGRFLGPSTFRWDAFTARPTFTETKSEDGDTVRIVFAHRCRSSPTPTPLRPQPFNDDAYYTEVQWRGPGTTTVSGVTLPDAVPGTTSPGNTSFCAWMEFSAGLRLYSGSPTPPPNDACADAEVIPALPFWSAPLDCSGSADAQGAVWYQYTAARTGNLLLTGYLSTYQVEVDVYAGTCGALGSSVAVKYVDLTFLTTAQGSGSVSRAPVLAGQTYLIRARAAATTFGSRLCAGSLQLQVNYQEEPEEDDLYIAAVVISQWRRYPDGRLYLVNVNPTFAGGGAFQGVALDYTQRTINDVDAGGTNSNVRVLVSELFASTVWLLNAPDLSFSQTAITFVDLINDPIRISGLDAAIPGQLHVSADGVLTIGATGNGFTLIVGLGLLPRQFNTNSDNPTFAAVRRLSAADGDNQPGAPFTAESFLVAEDVTAPFDISCSPDGTVLFYNSSGLYLPVGGQTTKRFSTQTLSQLGDLVTLPADGSINEGVRGLEVLPDGSVLIANGGRGVRVMSNGSLAQTYLPSRPDLFPCVGDLKLSADGTKVWVWDLFTNAVARFDLVTGAELEYWETGLYPGGGMQIALYQPNGVVPPPPPRAGCPTAVGLLPAEGTGCNTQVAPQAV